MSQHSKKIWETSPPWSKEQIEYSVFSSLTKTRETLNQLRGSVIFNEIESLRFSFDIFQDSIEDLISSINIFKSEKEKSNFWDRPHRQKVEKLERSINRGIFSSVATAMALVDHSREFNKKYPVKYYKEKINQTFNQSPQHKFIHSLRRYFLHVKITKANLEVETSKEGKSVFFLLSQSDLLKWTDWSALAKQYIHKHPEGINIEDLFDKYLKSVKNLHDWLRSQIWELYAKEITEFLSYSRAVDGVSAYCSWNLLIQQIFIPKGINPYMFLDRYLTANEIKEILALDYRSKEQVDRIIEIIDEYKVCDDKLRKNIYKFFGIK